MSDRGVLYIIWGDFDRSLLERSVTSLRTHHPELPVEVARLADDATLLDKARMFDLTPFDETLYLDCDTAVLDRLDFGFEKARRFAMACSICECPWARRYGGHSGDTIEYNTGVLFFTKDARGVFEAWASCVAEIDSSIVHVYDGQLAKMPLNDQAGFAKAIEDTAFLPCVLPYNWNFRPKWHKTWYGPIKIWHDPEPVPEPILKHNGEQALPDAVIKMSALRF